jgi:hypothetical protein
MMDSEQETDSRLRLPSLPVVGSIQRVMVQLKPSSEPTGTWLWKGDRGHAYKLSFMAAPQKRKHFGPGTFVMHNPCGQLTRI